MIQDKLTKSPENPFFDIIFMDVNMPETSGIQCIQ
jgi:CheY-like chemotaxis protein